MIDEELNPFECEFIDVLEDAYGRFSFVFPHEMKRVPYDEDEPEDTRWEGDFRYNDNVDTFINDDEALDKRTWFNFSDKDSGFYY